MFIPLIFLLKKNHVVIFFYCVLFRSEAKCFSFFSIPNNPCLQSCSHLVAIFKKLKECNTAENSSVLHSFNEHCISIPQPGRQVQLIL